MSNSLANVKVVLSFPSGGGTVSPPAINLNCPFQGMSVATIDVPDAEASATAHAVPFGSVDEATMVLVQNSTGQTLDIKINGAAAVSHQIPNGGCQLIAAASAPSTALASVSCITTGIQSGEGKIYCWVFGDAV